MEIRDTRNGDWHWVNNAVTADKHLTPAEKVVYYALCTFAGYKEMHPSYELLAERSAISERSCKSAVKKLIEVGYLEVEKGGGKGHANVYKLLKTIKGCKFCTVSKGAKNDSKGCKKQHAKGANSAPHIDKDKKIDNIDIAPTSVAAEKPFIFSDYIESMFTNKDQKIGIIAGYWVMKGFTFQTAKQAQQAIVRSLRAAERLAQYDKKKVGDTLRWLREHADFKWTLETVEKYIDEDLAVLTEKSGGKKINIIKV